MKTAQFNMDNQNIEPPYQGICCAACWFAKGEKCECRCGGAHHGKGSGNRLQESALKKFYPSAQKYMKLIKDPVCGSNARHFETVDLSHETIWGYPHTEGWEIEESEELQWLYISCPVCGYDHALWKLGVSRSSSIQEEETE